MLISRCFHRGTIVVFCREGRAKKNEVRAQLVLGRNCNHKPRKGLVEASLIATCGV